VFKNGKNILINSIWFQTGWLACVVIGNIAAIPISILTIILHSTVIKLNRNQWKFVAATVVTGAIIEYLFLVNGILIYPDANYPPYWMMTLWLLFSTLVIVSLNIIIIRKLLFAILSFLGSITSYVSGVFLSDAEFGYSVFLSSTLIAFTWFAVGLWLHWLYRCFKLNQ